MSWFYSGGEKKENLFELFNFGREVCVSVMGEKNISAPFSSFYSKRNRSHRGFSQLPPSNPLSLVSFISLMDDESILVFPCGLQSVSSREWMGGWRCLGTDLLADMCHSLFFRFLPFISLIPVSTFSFIFYFFLQMSKKKTKKEAPERNDYSDLWSALQLFTRSSFIFRLLWFVLVLLISTTCSCSFLFSNRVTRSLK